MIWRLNYASTRYYMILFRWYADPGTLPSIMTTTTKAINGHHQQNNQNAAAAAPAVVALTNSPVARPSVPSSIASSSPSVSTKSSDLLADLDFFTGAPVAPVPVPTSTAFSPPRKMHSSMPHSISQPAFANFQNADFFFPGPFSFSLLLLFFFI